MTDQSWWSQQRRMTVKTMADYKGDVVSLGRLANDMLAISDSLMNARDEVAADGNAVNPVMSDEWFTAFESAAGEIEVIFAVALDRDWTEIPAPQASQVDEALARVAALVAELPEE